MGPPRLKAQARPKPGPARPGPSLAQARFLEIWKSGAWKPGNLDSKKIPKIRILKINIRSAQNVGKIWISRKKSSWPHLGLFQAIFSMGRKHAQIAYVLSFFLGGSMAAIQPV